MKQAAIKDQTASILKHYDSFPDSANVRLPVVAALNGCSEATVWRMADVALCLLLVALLALGVAR